MIMDGVSNMVPQSKASSSSAVPVEHLDLSFESYNFSAGQALGETAQGGRGGTAAGGAGGLGGEGAFDDTLNTPRTATSDFNFNFIKTQLDFSQEAPPIIGESSVCVCVYLCRFVCNL
jgi:hypothetical protein